VKKIITFLSFVINLIPMTLSVSMERQQTYPEEVRIEYGESHVMSTAEIVGVSAAIAAAGVIISPATDDDSSSAGN
jgi:hypothetical protein